MTLTDSFYCGSGIQFSVGGAEWIRTLGINSQELWTPSNAFNTANPLVTFHRCIGSTDRDEKPRCEVQQRYLCPCFCDLLQTGKPVFP